MDLYPDPTAICHVNAVRPAIFWRFVFSVL